MRGQHHAPAALYFGKESVPILQEAGWAPGPVWTGAENLAPTGVRSADRTARSQSLYRLRYPAHKIIRHLPLIVTTIRTKIDQLWPDLCSRETGNIRGRNRSRSAAAYSYEATGCTAGESWIESRQKRNITLFSKASNPTLGPSSPLPQGNMRLLYRR